MTRSSDAAIDRQPAVRAGGDEPEHVVERRRRVDRRQARARDHQLPRGAQAEPQRPVQPHLLVRLEQAAVAALGDEQLDLFGRVDVAMAGVVDAACSFSSRMPLPLRKAIDQANSRCDHCIGSTVTIAVRVGSCSASDLGTSSPRIIASTVRTSRTMTADGGQRQSRHRARATRSNERRDAWRETAWRVGAEDQAGEGDADLRGGDVAIERVRVSRGPAGAAPPGGCRPPRAAATGSAARRRRRTPPPRTAPSAGSAG